MGGWVGARSSTGSRGAFSVRLPQAPKAGIAVSLTRDNKETRQVAKPGSRRVEIAALVVFVAKRRHRGCCYRRQRYLGRQAPPYKPRVTVEVALLFRAHRVRYVAPSLSQEIGNIGNASGRSIGHVLSVMTSISLSSPVLMFEV